jgi:hypothetical protein
MDDKTRLYTWVAKAVNRQLKCFPVPEQYSDAAKDIASQGNGFHYDGNILSWE